MEYSQEKKNKIMVTFASYSSKSEFMLTSNHNHKIDKHMEELEKILGTWLQQF